MNNVQSKNQSVVRMRGLPDDASPEQREDDIEKQGAPDDKVVDPGPVVCVQGKLQHTGYTHIINRHACRAHRIHTHYQSPRLQGTQDTNT